MLYKHSVDFGYEGDGFDTVNESYRNISGLFKITEPEVRNEINYYVEDVTNGIHDSLNYYGVDINDPFKDLFTRTGTDYIYTINHSKKIVCSLKDTKVWFQGTINDHVDPLPFLLAYGRSMETGDWLGDIISVSNFLPDGYELLSEIIIKD